MCETSEETQLSELDFWRAISILIRNYHAINKKLSGVKIIEVYEVTRSNVDVTTIQMTGNSKDFGDKLYSWGVDARTSSEAHLYNALNDISVNRGGKYIILSKLLYKRNSNPSVSLVQIIDFNQCLFQSIPLDATPSTDTKNKFTIFLRNGQLHVETLGNIVPGKDDTCLNWLKFVLYPRLVKWSKLIETEGKSKSVKSLTLIDIEEYAKLYSVLKEKYGQDMVERWTETTDPLKFVYEDVAIATYLILLWKITNNYPKNFIDMGCGNGLLVHILNSEGYHGYGADIRKRKIWDIYPETTKLKEETIIPNQYSAYKDVDWIIGNHSDELSPWIPVIAAMCSYNTKYFLLPCCAYEFSGSKFQRRNCSASVYNDFLSYVERISTKCRFQTAIDRLKIPSTKRVAIIGTTRTFSEEDYPNVCQEIENFVKSEIERTKCVELKIREKHEAVRNCTKIDRNIIDNIVKNIFEYILKEDGGNERMGKWRIGRSVTLQELASYLSSDDLKSIKSECGGLKTLIKNKHDIFEVVGDRVKLRYPRKREERPKGFQYKRRPCYFFAHHPDGCPLSIEECTFVHERIKV